MERPVLGVVCCTRTIGEERAQAVMERYVAAAISYADAAALLVPSLPSLMTAREVAPRIDGLLLTGSPSNVAPALYGQADAVDAEGPFDAARDTMTRDLVDACLALQKPVFGICRGLQELNVAFGGTLRRDTSKAAELLPHHAPADADWDGMFGHGHDVALAEGGVLRRAIGQDRLWVNSVHFQGIDQLGAGLRVEATAPDGMIEAFSARVNGAPVLAVQWHPEWQTEASPQSQTYFRLLGSALRGELEEFN
ncbi:gamma-glutamyl-gamma-aminobutyrate hydrolase family protein [Sphingomonas sp. MMSM20]|uniref:gamma-glutamyl-gamma-aminobutyrate hydrolase family protein n=1 Tax=Sphingomonas lycopersici TaxID=2951807 RepID=UPI0022390290|nr:gamma-glutamyl-gamma-aminobutyrate hydrolase family protein [Sphingomonas lycopersici]MCW6528707.1 gamma-glutamyl-gamma-aminobutyrate hydrolase family protein [Sphingomonas lycopersici]